MYVSAFVTAVIATVPIAKRTIGDLAYPMAVK
jgi:hypothetical protein